MIERKFYTNDFEQLLKENADQFKMSPSKKVWHGIYNDIHPGRRWPSIAISLVFLFTLVLVGHLNTQQSDQNYVPGSPTNINPQNASVTEKKNLAYNRKPAKRYPVKNGRLTGIASVKPNPKIQQDVKAEPKEIEIITSSSNSVTIVYPSLENKNSIETVIPVLTSEGQRVLNTKIAYQNKEYIELPVSIAPAKNALLKVTPLIPIKILSSPLSDYANSITLKSTPGDKFQEVSQPGKQIANPNVPIIKARKKSKISWTYYMSPSISYRRYAKQNNDADQMYLRYLNTSVTTDLNRAVTHRPSLGLETGLALKYPLAKKLKFTAGFQLNYSSYTIQANNVHPIIATLVLHDEKTGMPYAISSISYFGNGPGVVPEYLKNYSLNVGIPIGLEFQLAGNSDVQFSAAASFQPTLVLSNSAYILSTDRRNYITEPSLSRRVNLSTNIGTMISFKSNKFKWQIGPQVRYQLLSSFTTRYQAKEHLIDYGIRLGISK